MTAATLREECDRAFARVDAGARAFTVDELSGDADLRLYRLDVEEYVVHVRAGDPVRGRGVDTRLRVAMDR